MFSGMNTGLSQFVHFNWYFDHFYVNAPTSEPNFLPTAAAEQQCVVNYPKALEISREQYI